MIAEDNNTFYYRIEKAGPNYKLQDFLQNRKGYSSRLIRMIKREGSVLLNGRRAIMIDFVAEGDEVLIKMPVEKIDCSPQNIPLKIVYEDHDILVADKESGMVTHPTRSHQENNLANAVANYFMKTNISAKIRFVNRLDRDTTGLVVIAKNKFAHQHIQNQMQENKVEKIYFAVVEGIVEANQGTIDLPIGRNGEDTFERSVMEDGKPSVTHYTVLKRYEGHTLVRLNLETGRTHQIRVHMKAIGHPITGDSLYNINIHPGIERQALHAGEIEFSLPRSGEKIRLSAPIPKDMSALVNDLSN
ncbi:MAG: RluA family pseudouridine synthase [Eubacteriaceae bacterium]|nr:RluA family pseudouridine synthase [Eubacteriaceae bacterium]